MGNSVKNYSKLSSDVQEFTQSALASSPVRKNNNNNSEEVFNGNNTSSLSRRNKSDIFTAQDVQLPNSPATDRIEQAQNSDQPRCILIPLEDTFVTEENRLILKCRLGYLNGETVSWYRNKELIQNGRIYEISNDDNGWHRLIVDNARCHFDGDVFACKIDANGNVETTSAIVHVEKKSEECNDLIKSSQIKIVTGNDNASSDATLDPDDLVYLSSDSEVQTDDNLIQTEKESHLSPFFAKLVAESSFECYYDDEKQVRHRLLTPIIEENEDVHSFVSSIHPPREFDEISECNLSASRQLPLHSASYDSLASFEANERLLMSLESSSKKEAKRCNTAKSEKNEKRLKDSEERDILKYELRRQNSGSSDSPVSSPITSHTYYTSTASNVCRNTSELSDNKISTKLRDKEENHSNQDISPNTMKVVIDNHQSLIPNLSASCSDESLDDDDASHRSLFMQTLERNIPSEGATVCTSVASDDDHLAAFEDRMIGYLNPRPREDSVLDLISLQKFLTANAEEMDAADNDKKSASLERDINSVIKSETKKDKHQQDLKKQSIIEIDEKTNVEKYLELDSGEDTTTATTNESDFVYCSTLLYERNGSVTPTQRDYDQKIKNQGQSRLNNLCIFNDHAQDAISSCEGDFHSCASTEGTYEVARDDSSAFDIFSDQGYLTPPEYTKERIYATVIHDGESNAAVISSGKSLMTHRGATTTSGATGYQTPPKYYYVIPPKFIGTKSAEVMVSRGGTAVLDCSIVSHPEAKVAWYKDGRLLEIYDRISQHTSNQAPLDLAREYAESSSWEAPPLLPTEVDIDIGCVPQLDVHYLLKIKNAMKKDEGIYVCKAWNTAGVATRIIRLSVSNYIT